ncbi:MAG: rhomboid family intramembrane serine protease [Pseudomonadota bacterium]
MSEFREPSPVNSVPPLILAIALSILAIEVVFQMGNRGMLGGPEAVGWRLEAIRDYAFSNRGLAWMLETGELRFDFVKRLVTYPFLHSTLMQALFAAVMTLALGKFVGERMAQWAVFVLFFASAAGAAIVYGVVLPEGAGLIGAFPGVYGLIGGFTYLIWLRLGQLGENQTRAFSLIGFLMGIQLIFGVMYGSDSRWLADVAGFLIGFVLSIVLVPGGFRSLQDKLRQR